jgi:hypothetical protein
MDGCFENGITASDDVSARQMGRDIGLDTNTDELATVGETVVFGTDASGTATRQLEHEGLAGATSLPGSVRDFV